MHRRHTVLVRALSLLMLCCGDVETNPGPPKARSEVLRMFMRYIQTDLVHLIYRAKKVEIPSPLYDVEPPGWSTFDKDIKFRNICNIQNGGNQIFHKLIKLCRQIGVIPKTYIDVILCFEKLSNSRKKTEESEKLKTTLENFVARSKSMKTKEALLEHLDEDYLAIVLQKATEKLRQGALSSSSDGFCKLFDAAKDFVIALEREGKKLVRPSTSGIKRPATEVQTTVVIKEEKRQKDLPSCKHQRSNRKTEASKGKKMKTGRGSNSRSSKGLRYLEQDGTSESMDFTSNFSLYISQCQGKNIPSHEGGFTWPIDNQSLNQFENQQTLEVLPETEQVIEPVEDSGSDSDGYIPPMQSLIGMPVDVPNEDCPTVWNTPTSPSSIYSSPVHSMQTEDNFHEDANLRGMDINDMVKKYEVDI